MSCGILGLIIPLGAGVVGGCVSSASAAVLFAMDVGLIGRVCGMCVILGIGSGVMYESLIRMLGGHKSALPKKDK